MKKKLFALILALVMILGATTFALAALEEAETEAGVRIRTGFTICPPGCDCDDCDDDFEWNGSPVGNLWFGEHNLGYTGTLASRFNTVGVPASGGRYTGISVMHALPMTDPGNGDDWGPRTVAVEISEFTLDGVDIANPLAVEGKVGFELDLIAVPGIGGTLSAGVAPTVSSVTLEATGSAQTVLAINANTVFQAVWHGVLDEYVAAPQVGHYQATLTWSEVIAP